MPTSARTPRKPPDVTAPLAALVRAALAGEGRRPGELGIVLTGDAPVRELNRRWRGLDRATDVLSFCYDDPPGAVVNGDLIVSMDRVIEQAKRFRVTRGKELARLIVHGALHLAGLDHKSEAQRRHMRTREAQVLRQGAKEVQALEKVLDGVAKSPRGGARAVRPQASRSR
jgi:probable rRNA maturation factor